MTSDTRGSQLAFAGMAAPVDSTAWVKARLWLLKAREVAAELSARTGSIAAEDVRGHVAAPPEENLWGGLLCRPWFVPTGERFSRHKAGHGRKVKVWLVTATGRRELLGE